ncbi:hypothetical protein [Streptomyces gulbargensis]|uniref:hypothetical protein n=1 Tax=Streptomyces gulbargensis TaxID=364901 RepID=UPI0031E9B1E5
MAETADGAVLAARTLQRITRRDGSDSPDHIQAAARPDWIGEARSLISREIVRHLAPAARQPVDQLTEPERTLLWAWRHSAPENARAWINQRLEDRWTPLDLLAVLLPHERAPFPFIDHDTLQSLDALIGLEALYSRLGPLLDAPDPDNPQDEHRERILQALRQHRGHPPGSD